MLLTLLKSKIHRATVTKADLNYEGSCAIDSDLMDAAGIVQYERIDIYNVNNAERFSTYALCAESGSGDIIVNGAAARLAQPGDLVIICAYGQLPEADLPRHTAVVVSVDSDNKIDEIS
jgi:aspartate 1-decarboxylase